MTVLFEILVVFGWFPLMIVSLVSFFRVIRDCSWQRALISLLSYPLTFFIFLEPSFAFFCFLIGGCHDWGEGLGGFFVLIWITSGLPLFVNTILLPPRIMDGRLSNRPALLVFLIGVAIPIVFWTLASTTRNLEACWSVHKKDMAACDRVIASPWSSRKEKASAHEGKSWLYRWQSTPSYENTTESLLAALAKLPKSERREASGLLMQLAEIELKENGNYKAAIGYLDQAIEIQPENRYFRSLRSEAHLLAGNTAAAITDRDAASAPPGQIVAVTAIREAFELARAGQKDEAIEAINEPLVLEFLKKHPERAFFEGCQVFRKAGRTVQAASNFLSFVDTISPKFDQSWRGDKQPNAKLRKVLEIFAETADVYDDEGNLRDEPKDRLKECFADDQCYDRMFEALWKADQKDHRSRYFGP